MPKDSADTDEWLSRGQSYFYTARLLCQELLSPHQKWSDNNPRVPVVYPPLAYKKTDLLSPAFYCINHGIELILKEALENLNIAPPQGSDGHDLKKLFSLVKEMVCSKNQWTTTNRSNQEIVEETLHNKDAILSELESLIDYFTDCAALGKRFDDRKNELHRYPASKGGASYKMDMLENVDVSELLKKLDTLYGRLMDVGFIITCCE